MNRTLQQAIDFIKAGRKAEARQILEPLIESDKQNIPAWLWYIETWSTVHEKIKALELCQQYNPDNDTVQRALTALRSRLPPATSPSAPPIVTPISSLPPAGQRRSITPHASQPVAAVVPARTARKGPWLVFGLIAIAGACLICCGGFFGLPIIAALISPPGTPVAAVPYATSAPLNADTPTPAAPSLADLPAHTVAAVMYDPFHTGSNIDMNTVQLLIVIRDWRTFTQDQAWEMVRYYEAAYQASGAFGIDFLCDNIYATQEKFVTEPDTTYYPHVLFAYTRPYKDVTGTAKPFLMTPKDNPEFGSACH